MADSNPTLPLIKTLTESELQSLADRLYARGTSALNPGSASSQGDMVLASRAIRGLLAKLDKAAGSVAETQRLLAEIHIELGA